MRSAPRGLPLLFVALGLVWTMPLRPAPATASILPQIEMAQELGRTTQGEHGVLSKHYVEVAPGQWMAVRGARERRQIRFARWVAGLKGDRLAVYTAEGYPLTRYRELDSDRLTEIWSYGDEGWTYVFEGNELIHSQAN